MEPILRATVVYFLLLLILRISGKRSLASITTFDLVLVLIIAEASQQALVGDDFSITTAGLVIATLVVIDIGLSLLSRRFEGLEKVLDSTPLLLVNDGELVRDHLAKERVTEQDILEMGRDRHGLERLDQVRYAVLERGGHITIVPR